jgi:hypothetical protein
MFAATCLMACVSFLQPFKDEDVLSVETMVNLEVLFVLFAALYLQLSASAASNVVVAFFLIVLLVSPLILTFWLLAKSVKQEVFKGPDVDPDTGEAGGGVRSMFTDTFSVKKPMSRLLRSGRTALQSGRTALRGGRSAARSPRDLSGKKWQLNKLGGGNSVYESTGVAGSKDSADFDHLNDMHNQVRRSHDSSDEGDARDGGGDRGWHNFAHTADTFAQSNPLGDLFKPMAARDKQHKQMSLHKQSARPHTAFDADGDADNADTAQI